MGIVIMGMIISQGPKTIATVQPVKPKNMLVSSTRTKPVPVGENADAANATGSICENGEPTKSHRSFL